MIRAPFIPNALVASMMTAAVVAAAGHLGSGQAGSHEVRHVLVSVVDRTGQPLLGLQAEDLVVENDGTRCDIVDVTPAAYPLAIILDTSSDARTDFQALRAAASRFVERLAPRAIALYTSGTPASRVEDFTADRSLIVRGLARTFAAPNSTTHQFETLLRVSQDIRRLDAPVSGAVVLSAGAVEMSPPAVQQVFPELLDSHTIVHVVERHSLRVARGTPRPDDADVFEAVAARTHGQYVHGAGASVYAFGLDAIQRRLDGESIVSYTVASNAPHDVTLRVQSPATVAAAISLDRAR